MAKIHIHGDFVGPGEKKTATLLEKELPESWDVISNKYAVFSPNHFWEIDFIIIGNNSVFVVDEKNYKGTIRGNETIWLSNNREEKSPINKIENIAKYLAGDIRKKFREAPHGQIVQGLILFSDEQVKFDNSDPRFNTHILKLNTCINDLINIDIVNDGELSISSFRNKIVDLFCHLPDKPRIPREIGPYTIQECVYDYGPIICLKSKHQDGEEIILKLIELPSTLQETEKANDLNFRLREYHALKSLSMCQRTPDVSNYFTWSEGKYFVIPIKPFNGLTLRADRFSNISDENKINKVFFDAFKALNDIHSQNVIHRSLNPDRIFILRNDKVGFSDFITARIPGKETISPKSKIIESDKYRAPECSLDLSFATEKSDLYSLAASLYFWVTGNEYSSKVRDDLSLNEFSFMSKKSSSLIYNVLKDCLEEDPKDRSTTEHIIQNIDKVLFLDLIENRYRKYETLKTGEISDVYIVEDIEISNYYILKIIHNTDFINSALMEYSLLEKLKHDCLPRVYDYFKIDNTIAIKLEYVKGKTLKELLSTVIGDRDLFFRLAKDLLDTANYLDKKTIIHRDIAPQNILIPEDKDQPIKLIDFGSATKDSYGNYLPGTPNYRDPEVEKGGKWTSRCDSYSIAVILYEVITGNLPFKIDNGYILKTDLRELNEIEEDKIGKGLLDVLKKALSFDSSSRYSTPIEFLNALNNSQRKHDCFGDYMQSIDESLNPIVLTAHQKEILAHIPVCKPFLVRGVAGSGKTKILSEHVKTIIDGNGSNKKIAVVFFNLTFTQHLKNLINNKNIKIEIANRFFKDIEGFRKVDFDVRDPEKSARNYIEQLDDLEKTDKRKYDKMLFDAIYIDEGQDITPTEYQLLYKLTKISPITNERHFIIFYDDSQNLYARQRPNWKEIGIDLSRGQHSSRIMTKCIRNTKEIFEYSLNILVGTAAEESIKGAKQLEKFAILPELKEKNLIYYENDLIRTTPELVERKGENINIIPNNDANLIINEISSLIEKDKVAPHNILVTSPKWDILENIKSKLEKQYKIHFPNDKDFKENLKLKTMNIRKSGKITLSSIHSAKGYGFPIVFFTGIDNLGTSPKDRATFYVAATRSKYRLYVCGRRENHFIKESEKIKNILNI